MTLARSVLWLAYALAVAPGCDGSATGPEGLAVRERWYQLQPGHSWARPAVLGNSVYFGTGDGHVVARDARTGTVRWSTSVGTQQINGANLIARSGVVVAPVVAHTVGLDAATGRELWRYYAPRDTAGGRPGNPGQVAAARIDADEATVYIPAWGASISAIDLRTGAVRWIWQPGRMEGDTAASGVFRSGSMGARVSGDTIFATLWHYVTPLGGTSEAWVVALDRGTGGEFWRVRLPYQGSGVLIEAPPAIYRHLVIVHTLSARTYAIDRTTRQVAWEFSPPAVLSTIAGPELYADVLYLDAGDEHVYALRATDGSVIWRSAFPSQASRDLLVSQRRVTFTNGGTLFVLDRLTGRRIVAVTQPRTNDSFFASAAAFSEGLVFVVVGDAVWCFEEP